MRKLLLSVYPLVLLCGYVVLPAEVVPMKIRKNKSIVIFKDIDPCPKSRGTVKTYGTLSVKVV